METKSFYRKQFSSAEPGLLVILLDQSGSMRNPYPGGGTKANQVTLYVHELMKELISANGQGELPKDRVFVIIIGYNSNVTELYSGFLSKFAQEPLRVETVIKKKPDGNGGFVEVEEMNPVYFEVKADGVTSLSKAFCKVGELVFGWMKQRPNSPAPRIIHITDAMPRSEGLSDLEEEELCIKKAEEIMGYECEDGHPLLYNYQIGTGEHRCEFPSSESECQSEAAKFLFKITSEVCDADREAAVKLEIVLSEHSKGMVCDGDLSKLADFISFGSSAARPDRM